MSKSRNASSAVAWSLLTEGVTGARVDAHRLRILVTRALALVESSKAKEHLWQVAGDLIQGVPERLTSLETSLDRTQYALTVMGGDFLRGRMSLGDRTRVDDGVKSTPRADKESMSSRVARRYLASMESLSDEGHFFSTPRNREVREFALSKSLTNLPSEASVAVKYMDNATISRSQAVRDSKDGPPDPLKIRKGPGGKQFSTLNRYVVETEQPNTRGLPKGREDLVMHPKLAG